MELKTPPANGSYNSTAGKLYGNSDGRGGWSIFTGNGNKTTGGTKTTSLAARDFSKLDKVHIAFLLYSAAHNLINAFHRADNVLFFVFVLVGILSVEYVLWCLYDFWKKGMLIGKMKTIAKWGGGLAMFYATAGILSQAQGFTGSAWLDFHYAWIMPTSAPVMFIFSWWIQAIDPVMLAQQDAQAQQYFIAVDENREVLDIKAIALDERKDMRKMKAAINKKKIRALRAESSSRRTNNTLKRAAKVEMPYLLEGAGVSIKAANEQPLYTFLNSKYDVPKQLGQGPKNGAVNPRQMPGAHEQKEDGVQPKK